MNLQPPISPLPGRRALGTQSGSVLVIVLWVAFGLVTITLYFANSMTFELRASDNRVSSFMADQAIEGAARYAAYVLTTWGTNGTVPEIRNYFREAVPVGEARFWFIGRDNNNTRPTEPYFALIDENSKLNLNTTLLTNLQMLPGMTPEFAAAIVDWRDTDDTAAANGAESQIYSMLHPPYSCKNTNFETAEELRLLSGASMELLVGEDLNRNGVLDPDEYEVNRNGTLDPGLLEYLTVYGREPNNTRSNINERTQLQGLLQNRLGTQRANEILANFGQNQSTNNRSPLEFYRRSKMTLEEFAQIAPDITVTTTNSLVGRVNVNTASAAVLACLPGLNTELAQQLVNYRQNNANNLTSVAWVVEALGQNNTTALNALQAGDYLTTQSYQFTADIAAIGPYGRGYRRTRFVIDTSSGTPQVIYRQDLGHLGWALGKEARQTWLVSRKPGL